ncbi:unnamed protein product [Porites evermanni]|uniref:Uncharacterized protein n=1 Tax=Porites evermanni TaxID=104178 RepID=A0ABN8MAE5_9CNID|nr:unnamed protein product [Porites evermanni]
MREHFTPPCLDASPTLLTLVSYQKLVPHKAEIRLCFHFPGSKDSRPAKRIKSLSLRDVPGYLVPTYNRVPLTKNRLQAPFVAHNYEYKRCPKGMPNW